MRSGSAVLASIMFAALAATPASAVCSNATLNGAYGYFHGRPDGIGGMRAVVGQAIADGQGNLHGSFTMSLNGTVSTGTFTGTYSISKNCTGSFTLQNEDFSTADYNIVLDDSHKGFQMLQTDSGTAQPGFGLAQGTVTCGLTGKKLTLATNLLGTLTASSDVDAIVGQVELDGKGNISGTEAFSVAGAISTASVTGTYTENADCTGTAQITPAGSATTNFNTVVVNEGKELLLIETDGNTVVAGTAQE
ncbi:MAG: hypothetical protein WBW53_21700 [Terriglobales bacterium]